MTIAQVLARAAKLREVKIFPVALDLEVNAALAERNSIDKTCLHREALDFLRMFMGKHRWCSRAEAVMWLQSASCYAKVLGK